MERTLREVDDQLREKYQEIVAGLSLQEVQKFNKFSYKELVKQEMKVLLKTASDKQMDDAAHYISIFFEQRSTAPSRY